MKVTNILRWGCFGVVWREKMRIFCILEPPYDVKIHKTVHRKTLGFFHEKFISWLIRKCAKKTFLMACALCNGNIGMEVCTISNDESHTFLLRYALFQTLIVQWIALIFLATNWTLIWGHLQVSFLGLACFALNIGNGILSPGWKLKTTESNNARTKVRAALF